MLNSVSESLPGQPLAGGRLRIAVGIATKGRAPVLRETLNDLEQQTLVPQQVLVLYGTPTDVDQLPSAFPRVRFLQAGGGLCEKRNRILDEVADADLILYMDDDFLLDPNYLTVTEEAFRRDNGMVAATGAVLADGARGPGLSVEQGRRALARAGKRRREHPRAAFNAYGCNMTFRISTIRAHGLRFDEQLPAYGWYEDIDFSRRLGKHGALLALPGATGVHLGVKAGRVSGRRLGYSQVANPAYLWRKGSFPLGNTVRSIGRNFVANLFRSLRPEPYVDRRGRLRGNLLAFGDLLRGRMHPSRIRGMQ